MMYDVKQAMEMAVDVVPEDDVLADAERQKEELRDKLKRIVVRESARALGRDGSKLSEARSRLKRMYLGYGYEGDDDRTSRGLSTYVDRTVMEVVEWAKPGLLRVFSGDEIVRFDPRRPEDEKSASDATVYINQVVFGRNMFKLVHDTLADGLMQRVGWCLAHCPKVEERRVEKYVGLTQPEAAAVLTDPDIDLEAGGVEVVQYDVPVQNLSREMQEKMARAMGGQPGMPGAMPPGGAPQGMQPDGRMPEGGMPQGQPGGPQGPQMQGAPEGMPSGRMPQEMPQGGNPPEIQPGPEGQQGMPPAPMGGQPGAMPPGQPGMPGMPPQMPQTVTLFDVTVHRVTERRDIRIDAIPSEQVIISSDAVDVEHARFIAHWERRTASDLRKEGYPQDLIDELPPFSEGNEMPETEVGRRLNDETDDNDGLSGATREFKVYEAWLDADLNHDGIAEKVKVTYAGDGADCRILDFEEWPMYRAPLFAACSVPMPHQAVGLCVADLVTDLQDLRSELTRQYLDNLALTNQGELVVNEGTSGEVEYDSLLARGVGSIHRLRGDATITPLSVASSAADTLQGLTMSSELIERRTGISSRTQSIKADTLQNTATGASIQEEALNQRLELVARVYAETFFKPLGRYLLNLVHKYQDREVQLRLRGRFMKFDPRKWDPDMDVSVTVGLGTGDRSRMVSTYQAILQLQQAFIQQMGTSSPVRLPQVVYTCHKMAEAAGLEAPERFFGTEEDAEQAERQAVQEAQNQQGRQGAGDAATAQLVQVETAKAQGTIQAAQAKAQAQIQLEREKAQADAQLKAVEADARIQLEREKAAGKIQIKQAEMAAQERLDAARLMMDAAARPQNMGW